MSSWLIIVKDMHNNISCMVLYIIRSIILSYEVTDENKIANINLRRGKYIYTL